MGSPERCLPPIAAGIKILLTIKNMKPTNSLDQINSEEKVNSIISRDEESTVKDTSAALEMAEELILSLPKEHEGREKWLTLFGHSAEAKNLQQRAKGK